MHSPSSVRFEDHFADLTDPRRRKVVYPLVNIVAIAICAVIAGVQYDTSCRWPVRSTLSAVICSTSWLRS
jgi:hypothetical protein